jgi:hypothetical protein
MVDPVYSGIASSIITFFRFIVAYLFYSTAHSILERSCLDENDDLVKNLIGIVGGMGCKSDEVFF